METLDNIELLNDTFGLDWEDDEPAKKALSPQKGTTKLCMVQPKQANPWDPRLILDLAIGVDQIHDILPRYNLTEEEFNKLSEVPHFRQELALAMRDTRENGITFARKAKVQAESYLEVLDNLVYSDFTPANVRLEAIRSTVLWGGLVPKDDKNGNSTNANQINISINF